MQVPFFYEAVLPDQPGIFTLSEDTSKHCVQVLRMNEGAIISLTNGKGIQYIATILSPNKNQTVVTLANKLFDEQTKPINSIAISFVKNASRMEWFLEKATEIGIAHIYPLTTERTEKSNFKLERWESILVSAMLQSKQVWKPILHEPSIFMNFVSKRFEGNKMIAHCENDNMLSIPSMAKNNHQLILIGPEGDFTTKEIELAISNNFIPVSLGNSRLRTETAGIVASVLLQN
jgi:16S rRNA (uracil1498-N3)-methyltransferase